MKKPPMLDTKEIIQVTVLTIEIILVTVLTIGNYPGNSLNYRELSR